MRYYGGLGAGRSWVSLKFILTPDELPKIFDGLKYSFVTTNSRVEINYLETPKQDYFQAYKSFFEKLLTGQKSLSSQEYWKIEMPVRESIIDDIRKISFEEIRDNRGKLIPYKLVEPLEPVINISTFYLFYLEKQESLSTAYQNEEGILGLQLQYPKCITLCDEERPDYLQTIETNSFDSYALFETLVKRIKKITQKAKIQTPSKLFRPNFWISKDAIPLINKNKYLKKNQFEVK